jgi:hypothetical protein
MCSKYHFILFSCSEGDNPIDYVLENTQNGGGISIEPLKNRHNPSIAVGDPNAKFLKLTKCRRK